MMVDNIVTREHRGYAIYSPRRKPLLIWAAPLFLAFQGLSTLAFTALVALEGGEIKVGFGEIPGLGRATLGAPFILATGLMSVAAAYGLFTGRLWARSLLTKWSLIGTASVILDMAIRNGADPTALAITFAPGVVMIGVQFWYFYRYRRVVEYYKGLEAREELVEE